MMVQTCNVGGFDKQMRLLIGFGLGAYALLGDADNTKKATAGVISAIALSTAFSGYCPLNALTGINTCEGQKALSFG